MPLRTVPLVTEEIYHVLNRGNASIPIFKNKYDFQKFVQTFAYYQHANPLLRYSKFADLSVSERDRSLKEIKSKKDLLVEIIAYCLMPNHFHFMLKQKKNDGILNFIRLSTNSHSHYFNIKHKRKGVLFEGRFKAVRIESDSQLTHLSRYIHLNPYSSFIVKDFENLIKYPFSSFAEYIGFSKESICHKQIVLNQFGSPNKYKNFVLDQADYQKKLELIKEQALES